MRYLSPNLEQKLQKLQQQISLLIAKGVKHSHPYTIAHLIKHQLIPSLYGIEFAILTSKQQATLDSRFRTMIKSLFSLNSRCSNIIFDTLEIPNFSDIIKFRNSINLSQLLKSNYTRKIIQYTSKTNDTNYWINDIQDTNSNISNFQLTPKFKYTFISSGKTDSIHTLLSQWNEPLCRKQYYDILHYNMNRSTPPQQF